MLIAIMTTFSILPSRLSDGKTESDTSDGKIIPLAEVDFTLNRWLSNC